MAASNNAGQFFTHFPSLRWSCHEERGPAWQVDSQPLPKHGRAARAHRREHYEVIFVFTLYTMRSCSPSLSVVPSYLISLTKDKANIFSDLSLAASGRKEVQRVNVGTLFTYSAAEKCTKRKTWLHMLTNGLRSWGQ